MLDAGACCCCSPQRLLRWQLSVVGRRQWQGGEPAAPAPAVLEHAARPCGRPTGGRRPAHRKRGPLEHTRVHVPQGFQGWPWQTPQQQSHPRPPVCRHPLRSHPPHCHQRRVSRAHGAGLGQAPTMTRSATLGKQPSCLRTLHTAPTRRGRVAEAGGFRAPALPHADWLQQLVPAAWRHSSTAFARAQPARCQSRAHCQPWRCRSLQQPPSALLPPPAACPRSWLPLLLLLLLLLGCHCCAFHRFAATLCDWQRQTQAAAGHSA